ncbi:MAG TPA: hypothetical protein VMU54_10490, partial [Planctomycetota bacterium]|nr:hypothetical protein [Planctomycetota bacterium]
YGSAFARQLSQSLLQQVVTLPDGNQKMMMANLLVPDPGSLSDVELGQMRRVLAASPDPLLRQKADALPDRGIR